MWRSLASLLFLWSTELHGSDAFLRYNIGALPPFHNLKGLSLGVQTKPNFFSYKYEVGFIADDRAHNISAMGQIGIGIEPMAGPFYIHFFQSIGAVSSQDNYLSGYFQFFEDLGVGIKDKNGTAIGFGYKHISNAGLSQPNNGKDFLNMEIRFPL